MTLFDTAVEAAAKAVEKVPHIVWNSPHRDDARTLARAALSAALEVLCDEEALTKLISDNTYQAAWGEVALARAVLGEVPGE